MNSYNQTTAATTPQTNQYKRTSRHPSDETRQKISLSMRGRPVSDATRQKLSDSLRDYWNNPENFPDDL